MRGGRPIPNHIALDGDAIFVRSCASTCAVSAYAHSVVEVGWDGVFAVLWGLRWTSQVGQ